MIPLIPVALSLVPSLAKWLVGDKAGDVATTVAAAVQAVTGTDDPAGAAASLADPIRAAELRVRLAEIERQSEAAERAAYLADLASARSQTVGLAQAGSRIAWAAPVISVVIMLGFFASVALLFLVERSWDERTANLLNVLFGALIPGFVQVCNYWLGSSAGSKRSGDAVRDIAASQAALRPPEAAAAAARSRP